MDAIRILAHTTFSLLSLLTFVSLTLAQPLPRSEVLRLPDDVAEKTEFLNPDYLLLTPDLKASKDLLPIVIYLHGAGGVGDDVRRIAGQPGAVLRSIERLGHSPCLLVAPQCLRHSPAGDRGVWTPADLDIFLHQLKETLPIDASRIYLTGNSMGGYGTWVWAATRPEYFAAIAPIVGGIGRGGPKAVTPEFDRWIESLLKVPIWAFAGAEDRVVPAERSQRVIDAVRAEGHKNARLTIYSDMGHNAGRRAYDDPALYRWLFSQKRHSGRR